MENEIWIKGKTITYIVKGIFNSSTYSSIYAKFLLGLKNTAIPLRVRKELKENEKSCFGYG